MLLIYPVNCLFSKTFFENLSIFIQLSYIRSYQSHTYCEQPIREIVIQWSYIKSYQRSYILWTTNQRDCYTVVLYQIISEVIHVVNIQSERTQRNLDVYWNNIWVYERVERFQMCNKCYLSCDPIQHVIMVDVSWFSWIHWYKIEVKINSPNHWILNRFENMV